MLEFVVTSDGSKTLYHPEIGEHYHSRHGAVQESRYVFLGKGLEYYLKQNPSGAVSILEIGFGTGLNFLLSAENCRNKSIQLDYTGVEAYPITTAILFQTGYGAYVNPTLWEAFRLHYTDSLHAMQTIVDGCLLEIAPCQVLRFATEKRYDVLYFDAFAAAHQPDMWTEETLRHACAFLKPGGIFVTYAITGHLKRTLKAMGFMIEKVPGAPGKREMLRAINYFNDGENRPAHVNDHGSIHLPLLHARTILR